MKPFNLEHAKAGAPVTLQASPTIKVKLYDFEMQVEKNTAAIVGSVSYENGLSTIHTWMQDGEPWYKAAGHPGRLIMAPLGQCDGRDVYVGDKLQHKEAARYIIAKPGDDFTYYRWLAPARNYPMTQLKPADHYKAEGVDRFWNRNALVNHANFTIRHGIDNGYLLDPAELKAIADLFSIGTAAGDTTLAKVNNLIKMYEEAQRKANERGQFLALIAKHANMGDGFAYCDVPFSVKTLLDAKQNAIKDRNNILFEIAKGCKLTEGDWRGLFAQVPEAVRLREVAIARHFYEKGARDLMNTHNQLPWSIEMVAPLPAESVTSELTKVK